MFLLFFFKPQQRGDIINDVVRSLFVRAPCVLLFASLQTVLEENCVCAGTYMNAHFILFQFARLWRLCEKVAGLASDYCGAKLR